YHFFFQAEDGIRDFHVTGVQTCALPIYKSPSQMPRLPAHKGYGAMIAARKRQFLTFASKKAPDDVQLPYTVEASDLCDPGPKRRWPSADAEQPKGGGSAMAVKFSQHVDIDAPPDTVWSLLSDVGKWPL